jgi:hypothetical protein
MKRSALEAKYLKEDRDARLEFIRAAVGTREGRLFFWWLLQIGKFGVNPFARDALVMSFGCGEQSVGGQVLAELVSAAPRAFPEMMTEQEVLREGRDSALARATEDEQPEESFDD